MKYLFFMVVLLPAVICAQTNNILPKVGGKVVYELIDSASGSAEALYNKSNVWFANSFGDSKAVIEVSTPNSRIIGKGLYVFDNKGGGSIGEVTTRFTIETTVKDGKFRIRLYNFLVSNTSSTDKDTPIESLEGKTQKGMMKKFFANAIEQINSMSLKLIANYSAAMKAAKGDDF